MEICCKNWHTLCLISAELGEKLWEGKIMEILRNTKCKICAENKKYNFSKNLKKILCFLSSISSSKNTTFSFNHKCLKNG